MEDVEDEKEDSPSEDERCVEEDMESERCRVRRAVNPDGVTAGEGEVMIAPPPPPPPPKLVVGSSPSKCVRKFCTFGEMLGVQTWMSSDVLWEWEKGEKCGSDEGMWGSSYQDCPGSLEPSVGVSVAAGLEDGGWWLWNGPLKRNGSPSTPSPLFSPKRRSSEIGEHL